MEKEIELLKSTDEIFFKLSTLLGEGKLTGAEYNKSIEDLREIRKHLAMDLVTKQNEIKSIMQDGMGYFQG